MAQAAKASPSQPVAINPTVQTLMSVIQKRRSVRVYKSGKVSDANSIRFSKRRDGRPREPTRNPGNSS